jgi:predicted DNA-binding transcriptional regulator AlpA
MLSEPNPYAQQPGEVRLLSAKEVCKQLGCSKSTLLRIVGDPQRGFPAALRLHPLSERSGLKFIAHEVADWVSAQRQLTVDLKERARPLTIHLARRASA